MKDTSLLQKKAPRVLRGPKRRRPTFHGNAVSSALAGFNFLCSEWKGWPAAMATLAFWYRDIRDKKHLLQEAIGPRPRNKMRKSLRAISTTRLRASRASTCGLSTWWSPTAFKEISSWVGFALICFQRLSLPAWRSYPAVPLAGQRCTRGMSR